MAAHVLPAQNGDAARAYVACDRREDMGRVNLPLRRLRQWRLTQGQMAAWIAKALGLKSKPVRGKNNGTFPLGPVRGNKRVGTVELSLDDPPCLKTSGHSLPLAEVVEIGDGQPSLDRQAIQDLVDLKPVAENPKVYQPSTVKRGARKLKTQAMHESWRKAYLKLKKDKPGNSDVWYSQQIAKMAIAQGRDAATIRKNMQK